VPGAAQAIERPEQRCRPGAGAKSYLGPIACALVRSVEAVLQPALQHGFLFALLLSCAGAPVSPSVSCSAPLGAPGLRPWAAQEVSSPAGETRFWLPADQEGPWLRADRLQHVGLSFTLGLGTGLAFEEPLAALPVLGLGVAKEFLDARADGASRRDLVADVVGVALACAALALLLDAP
jgi:hypothetical protein